jgi:hypothetical protein
MPSVGDPRALKRCNAMEGLHSNWRARTNHGVASDDQAGQSSVPPRVTRIVPTPVDCEGDTPSDLIRRTREVCLFFFIVRRMLTVFVLDACKTCQPHSTIDYHCDYHCDYH